MADLKNRCLSAGMRLLSATGGHKFFEPWTAGAGLIFTLHQVCPDEESNCGHHAQQLFDPNAILRVRPEFLESVISKVRQAGLDIISLDEAHQRLRENKVDNRFVCFTLDDGYRDNLIHAYPIFKKYNVPFTIYVPGNYPTGEGILWWQALQEILQKQVLIAVELDNGPLAFPTSTVDEKWHAYNEIYWWLRSKMPLEQIAFIKAFADRYDFDLKAQCQKMIMTWDEIRTLANDPLTTIGAHTMNHYAVSGLSEDELREDTRASINRLQKELGEAPTHMSYPYGDEVSAGPRDFDMMSEFGFKTAVTTRKGVVFPEHKDHLTALPRVSLNGDFQDEIFIDLYLTGSVFAMWNGFKKLNVA